MIKERGKENSHGEEFKSFYIRLGPIFEEWYSLARAVFTYENDIH